MTVVISATQVCDKCRKSRELNVAAKTTFANIQAQSTQAGWREIDDKHLCPDCLREVFA